ncbi:DUF1853 family protein [Motiliproteus sp. MSK22-1]|uniref:DUF1853 family protein n=1 Tax=Motiliproteus sp. MSK22-1 TaxID=1897630 RepID=UPI000978B176|nr:DUF1853 family protein [Motiliproteus sp. MSK22-1]OMH32689.1 hypothetical protein BGP75_14205 [Motiliproteus sp. MSK22-1]
MHNSNYQSPAVRDLAWSLLSPQLCLLTPPGQQRIWGDEAVIPFLNELDKQPEQLESYLERFSPRRLGIYFELLLTFYLEHCSEVAQIQPALRVQSPQRTIGEFDLLYRPKGSGSYTHLEVCVKFYLSPESGKNANQWLGLNRSDCLANKVTKMRDHQLKLADHPEAKKVLMKNGICVDRKLAIFRGRLFYYRLSDDSPQEQCPGIIETSHLTGWWLRQDDFLTMELAETRYRLLDRMQWLTTQPVVKADAVNEETLACQEVIQRLDKRPLMLARLQKTECGWVEKDRGVVVPRSWHN